MSKTKHYLEAEISSLFESGDGMWAFVQEASLDGVWYWDLEQPENLWLSPDYWRCLGIDPSTRKHSPEEFISVVFEEDLPKIMDNLERHYNDPLVPYDQEVRFKHADGSTVWVRCRGMAQRDADGKAIRMFGAHNDMTAEKAAIVELEQERARIDNSLKHLKLVTDGSRDGFWHWFGTLGGKVEMSDRFFTLLGYQPQEFNGNTELLETLLHPEDQEKTRNALEASVKSGKVFELEYRLRHKDRSYRWFRGRGTPYYDSDDRFVEMAGSITDIDHQKQLENELSVSNMRYDLSVQSLELGIWEWEVASQKLYWSKRYKEIFGVPLDHKPTYKDFISRIHPDDKEYLLTQIESYSHPGMGAYNAEYRMRRDDGKYIWIKANGQCAWDENDQLIRVVGSVEDVTKRREFEAERENLLAEFAAYNEFTNAILNSTSHLIIATDLNGIVKQYNAAAEEALGYSANEIVGKKTPSLWHMKSEIVEYTKQLAEELGEDVEPRFGSITIKARRFGSESHEWTICRKDGSTFRGNLTVTCIHDASGEVTGYLAVIEDITERKEIEDALRKSNEELEHFTYRTSHDLRSPLVSSLRILDFIEEDLPKENTQLSDGVGLVKDSLMRLENLVTDILEITKTKNMEEEYQLIDIQELIIQACDKFSHMDGYHQISFETQLDFTGKLYSQRSRVMLIVENLISNAIKYHDPSKVPSFIKISTANEAGRFVVEIEDNGIGFPEEKQRNLFKMFQRFHPRISFGSGLGLYMIQKAVDVIGGDIIFTDTGNGSLFKVSLPIGMVN